MKRVALFVLPVLLSCLGCTADLRSEALISEGVTDARAREGRAWLERMEQAHGKQAWEDLETTELACRDDWDSTLAWLLGIEPWDGDDELRLRWRNGSFEGQAELVGGERTGELHGLTATGQPYRREPGGELELLEAGDDEPYEFVLPALLYLQELPFRIGEASVVALMDAPGQSFPLYGRECVRVLASWERAGPSDSDQYVLWIDVEEGLLRAAEYTVRDQFDFVTATAIYERCERRQGVVVPLQLTVVGRPGDDTSNYLHQVVVSELEFDGFGVDALRPGS